MVLHSMEEPYHFVCTNIANGMLEVLDGLYLTPQSIELAKRDLHELERAGKLQMFKDIDVESIDNVSFGDVRQQTTSWSCGAEELFWL